MSPQVRDHHYDNTFRRLCTELGMNPDDKHVGGYVDWEWSRARHLFDGLFFDVAGKDVLEVGFHLGATSIVLAHLGARYVEGIDVDPRLLTPAGVNVARYGYDDRVFLHVQPPTQTGYDVISCVSVLEYMEPRELEDKLQEYDDLLRPGGYLVVYGSSNRFWPRESHAGGWTNYIPRAFDHFDGVQRRRGVSPVTIRRALLHYEDLCAEDGGARLLELRRRTNASDLSVLATRAANALLTPIGAHAGYVSPHVAMVLRKPSR